MFRTMLGMRGYSVIEAADGEQAVLLAESAAPDLILMDGTLPLLDGLGATRRIRELSNGPRSDCLRLWALNLSSGRTPLRQAAMISWKNL